MEPEVLEAEQLTTESITGEDVALVSVGSAGVILIVLVGGAVAGNAVLISLLSVGSGSILWIKSPKTIGEIPVVSHVAKRLPISPERKKALLSHDWKASVLRHELLLDIAVSLGVVGLFGTTVTGLVAAGLTGLSVSVLLRLSSMAKKVAGNMDFWKSRMVI